MGQCEAGNPLYADRSTTFSNPIYIGKIRHRGQLYEGQHDPIIDHALWGVVQDKRAAAYISRRTRNSQHASLLTGMIRDHADRPMFPSHAVKARRRYRYYVSSIISAVDGTPIKAPALRLPAGELERATIDAVAALLADRQIILSLPPADALLLRRQLYASQRLAFQLKQTGKGPARRMLLGLGLAIIAQPERIDASISRRRLIAILDVEVLDASDDSLRITIAIPTRPDRRGHNLKLVIGSREQRQPQVDPDLIALLRKAEIARQQLFGSSACASRRDREVERLARLAFLAPDIVGAILEGRQPPSLTARALMKHPGIPLD